METIEAINKSSIFSGLAEKDLTEILKITKERRFQKGDVVMKEGEEGDTMYLVIEGEVGVSKSLTLKFADDDYRETEKILTRFVPEDHVILGEMALIGKDNRSATISARSDCIFLEIKKDDFLILIEENPKLGIRLLMNLSQLLADRLRQSSQDITRLTTALSIALSK